MKEGYDIVIIGGGTNSLSIASYLGKCGLSVCICEERAECGGGAENVEPIPGCSIDPHATYLYGAAAPAFEQLELHKFGFRHVQYTTPFAGVTPDGKAVLFSIKNTPETLESIKKFSKKDGELIDLLTQSGEEMDINRLLVDFLRSIYWTPPPPSHIKLGYDELPWAKVLTESFPGLYDDSWNDMSAFELYDNLIDAEPLKLMLGFMSWYNGPHPSWKGCAIPGIACNLTMFYSGGTPRGGMHSYAHSLVRCALYHGAKIYTNSKVEEIIVEDGEAKGVILSDDALAKNKRIYATKAVLSNTHVMQTFLDLIPSRELDRDFVEKVKGINLKGGSLFVLSLVMKERAKCIGEVEELIPKGIELEGIAGPLDSRERVLNMERDVYALNTHPTSKDSVLTGLISHDISDPVRTLNQDYHVYSPIYLQVPPPEYHRDGPEAVNNAKEEITELLLDTIRDYVTNLTDDNIVAKFVNTPYDSELRNMAFVSGNWMGSSEEEDQWYNKRPLPELARYRTPIKNLYLCHQTSYPGGLALQAVSYNLMHILIEDLDIKPDRWWYPSPHFIPSDA